ncbi:NUDIX domain-containing protein [Streptomyces albogriseolus]|uniref:NUDIX domain-containing protein n=1 Tax=Streptomyces albogriseolus TaxID=1887 RepID=UPI003460AB14
MPNHPQAPAAEVPGVHNLLLVETDPPPLTDEQTAVLSRMWGEAVAANPGLFDGPTVVCAGLDRKAPDTWLLTWYRTTYRRYLLRQHPEHAAPAPSLFVSVAQPTTDGRLLVGRMAATTAAPGRWQLPGGTIEPPPQGEPLDMDALRRHAARELTEEIGHTLPPEDLTLWSVTRGNHGNVGLHFRAPACPVDALAASYSQLVSAETARNRTPELDRIAFIRSPEDLPDLGGPTADFLPVLAARHATASSSQEGPR